MILPDQFWREFEECQVPFVVLAGNAAGANSVAEALKGQTEIRKQEVLNSKHALESRVLRLAWDSGTPPQLSSMAVVVISGPAVAVGGRVRMLVAVPMSKFDLDDDRRAALTGAISATCGGFDVVLEDIADKPRDFKGGGQSLQSLHPPSKAVLIDAPAAPIVDSPAASARAGRSDMKHSLLPLVRPL
jgi:hypothetical protein